MWAMMVFLSAELTISVSPIKNGCFTFKPEYQYAMMYFSAELTNSVSLRKTCALNKT